MAMKPAFITGANVKIKLNDKVIAYAQDISYNLTVATIPIETMSRYEVATNEPVAHFVDGMLSVIKYTKVGADAQIPGANSGGNGQIEMGTFDHFNPGKFLESQTFDVEVYQKVNTGDLPVVIKIHDCRFTRLAGGISKRSALVEQFAFVGILLDQGSASSSKTGSDKDLT